MSKYPDVITDAMLVQYSGISDAELEQDIADTEREIITEGRRADAQALVAANTPTGPENKMAHFRADAYRQGVEDRKAFVEFLRKLREARQHPLDRLAPIDKALADVGCSEGKGPTQ